MNESLTRLVWRRAHGRCEYCQVGHEFDDRPFAIDHIIPRKHEGPSNSGNLALCCFRCNSFKGTDIAGLDPHTRRLTPLFNPRRHKWASHFRWHGPRLMGRTAIGRVTIKLLNINDPLRIALRAALIEEGVFPPS